MNQINYRKLNYDNKNTCDDSVKYEPKELYLDLMKKTLSFILWPEPPTPITSYQIASPVKRFLVSIGSRILKTQNMLLARNKNESIYQRINGEIWPIYADTMIVYLPKSLSKRLDIVVAIWDAFPDEISDGHVNWRKDKSVLLWWD